MSEIADQEENLFNTHRERR